MAGLDANSPIPTAIKLHQQSRRLEVTFDDGASFVWSQEFLRVHSPSAEVRGHSPETAVLQQGKRAVTIERIEPVGNYAVRFVFSDGHDSGIFSWDYLYELGQNQEALWQAYLDRLASVGGSRDQAPEPPAPTGGCASKRGST